MVDAALAEFGQVDILVNDAGTFSQSAFAELEVSEWDRVLAVNLRGVFLCTRFVLPGMLSGDADGSSTSRRSWARSAGKRWLTTAPARPA